jgi:CRP-like cAMP-binding protein
VVAVGERQIDRQRSLFDVNYAIIIFILCYTLHHMDTNSPAAPRANILKYRKGEQIIKQGDYGISIYMVLRGGVEVFRESGGQEMSLAFLGPGDTIGEMTFLNKKVEVRSASARATEDSELEVWHPSVLANKYEEVPPVLKIMIDQALSRLARMNNLLERLDLSLLEARETVKHEAPKKESRGFYRKEVELECTYAPANPAKDSRENLRGFIKNISMTGLRMEIASKNSALTSYNVGDYFRVQTVLPNQQPLTVTGKIVSVNKEKGKICLGMSFLDLPEHFRKTLWFFMLPT